MQENLIGCPLQESFLSNDGPQDIPVTTFLLTGATGQIGWELARTLLPLGRIVAPARVELDLSRPEALRAVVSQVKPDVIVNAAAYTSVDKAEEEPELARTINADAPALLALAAKRSGALLVHYSTDYVFNGEQSGAYIEDDDTGPLNTYGRSKLAGEVAVRESGADYLIFRTSWVYAARGRNFLKTILQLASERDELRVVADQFGTPTWARLVAEVTGLVLQQELLRRRTNTFASGTFHLAAAGYTSWHGFADLIVSTARSRGHQLKCRSVAKITSSDYPLPATRPANSSLDSTRLVRRYGLQMPAWHQCLDLCLAEMPPSFQ